MKLTTTILPLFGSFSLLAWQAGYISSTKSLLEKRAALMLAKVLSQDKKHSMLCVLL